MIPQQRCYSSLQQCTFSLRELLFSQKGGNISIKRARGAQMRPHVEALQRNMLTLSKCLHTHTAPMLCLGAQQLALDQVLLEMANGDSEDHQLSGSQSLRATLLML